MSSPRKVAIVGGGLAGLATAVALGSAGQEVTLFEARPFLGGRATSYSLNTADDQSTTIDNCQHVLLRCCTNLIDFYQRLNVADLVHFHREIYWIEPGGRTSVMQRGLLPAPLQFTGSFAKLRFLSWSEKISLAKAFLAARHEYGKRTDLDRITMLDWLREKKQPQGVIDRFWKQLMVSAISEDLETMAASHGIQVVQLGFLSRADAYEMGVPNVPLGRLYSSDSWLNYPNVNILSRAPVQEIEVQDGQVACLRVNGEAVKADAYVLAVPFERVPALVPELQLDMAEFKHAPITGIHLWFDRSITSLPHATLLDRTIQWMFNKGEGKHIQLVVSASRTLTEMPRQEVIDLAIRELSEFFPIVSEAKLQRAHVVKEVRALLSAVPNLEERRPRTATNIRNLYLAGDWTRSGWPAIMEGAVRSGYLAAEAVLTSFGASQVFLRPEIG